MNFLAHFHLAAPDRDLVAGALEGDYHKGPIDPGLSGGLQRGIRLHRSIDAYTDAHPVLTGVRRDFHPRLRRYAGILMDLSFDHFLSSHWSRFAEQPLSEFNGAIYRGLQSRRGELSAPARRMVDRLVHYDLLGRYTQWQTVSESAARIGSRFRRGNPFIGIEDELLRMRPRMETAFLTFYPALQDFTRAQRLLGDEPQTLVPEIALNAKNP